MENQTKKLYRSKKDRIIAGVCGGLGKYFQIDIVLVRLIFVALAFFHGLGFILYIILLIVVPKESGEKEEINREEKAKEFFNEVGKKAQTIAEEFKEEKACCLGGKRRNIIGIIIIIIGLVILLDQFSPLGWLSWKIFLAVLLILIGIYFIFKKDKKKNGGQ